MTTTRLLASLSLLLLAIAPALAGPGGFLGAYFKDGGRKGAVVARVLPRSPAGHAGLRKGDVVVAWDEHPTLGEAALADRLRRAYPGDEVRLAVRRGNDEVTLRATLGAWGDHTKAPSTVRTGSAILVAGVPFDIDAPVVTWQQPGGFDGYLERCFFKPKAVTPSRPAAGCDTPKRYGARRNLAPALAQVVAAQGWTPELAAVQIDQVVVHYDVAWTSANCFKVLHDLRGLSCHFMLGVDGTLYQSLDLVERARHAGSANDRSVGIEIAHPGPLELTKGLADRYRADAEGAIFSLSKRLKGGVRTKGFVVRPARPEPITAEVQGRRYSMYDYTDEQYDTLIKLFAVLHRVLPRIRLEVPMAADGSVRNAVLSKPEQTAFSGILGHYHVSKHKQDPGPAFDWKRVLTGARERVGK